MKTPAYQIFYETRSLGKCQSKYDKCNISIFATVVGTYMPDHQTLRLQRFVNTYDIPDRIMEKIKPLESIDTAHVMQIGEAARMCIRMADEYIANLLQSLEPEKETAPSKGSPYR